MPRAEIEQIELVDAAARLRIPYHLAYRFALIGRLVSTRRHGRWFVERTSVDRLEQELEREPAPAA